MVTISALFEANIISLELEVFTLIEIAVRWVVGKEA